MTNPHPTVAWRTSTHSNGKYNCVEVAPLAATVAVRDSKHRNDGPTMEVPGHAWRELMHRIASRM